VLSENNKFLDETDFWKVSGFDHACLTVTTVLALATLGGATQI